jgi:glucose-6-phosphate 1-dehydrogenase
MPETHADALVFFGATGDLAYQQIFPALQALTRRGHLDLPVIGVAKPDWTVDQLRARARDSVTTHGGLDVDAFAALAGRLSYVSGDYQVPDTFERLRQALGSATHPVFYLAIPPSLFGNVATGLARAGCAGQARLVVEKPFGRDLASAQALNHILHTIFAESAIYRIDHFLGKEPVQNLVFFRFAMRLRPHGGDKGDRPTAALPSEMTRRRYAESCDSFEIVKSGGGGFRLEAFWPSPRAWSP